MKVITINEAEFEEKVLNNEGKVLVDFYADWCGPCKMLSPVIEKISEENDTYTFYKINVDSAENVSRKYGVMSIPTLLVFDKGQVTKSSVGFKSSNELKEFLEI